MASIRKRVWTGRNGTVQTRYIVDYFDQHRVRHIQTFKTKKEAVTFRDEVGVEVRHGTHTAPSTSITVEEAADRWLKHCEAEGLERGTVRPYRNHVQLGIVPHLGGRLKLAKLNRPLIHDFIDRLRDAGKSPDMRKGIVSTLKTMLTYAEDRGWVARNVARGVKVKTDDRRNSHGDLKAGRDFPTMAELKLMIDKASDRWRPFVVTAIFTGMRASELRGLRWDDVDLDAGVIHITQRADDWGQIGPPKSKAGKRDIPLAPMALNALKGWKKKCPKGERGLVFPNRWGDVQSHQNIIHAGFYPLQVKCGITEKDGVARYGLHALRHAAASLFIEHLQWGPKRIMAVMGHSSIQMTFGTYGHLFEDHEGDREAMKKIEAAIGVG